MRSGRPRLFFPLGPALLVLLVAGACALFETPDRRIRGDLSGGGALDTILLCEKSFEAGPLHFDHRLHYAPQSEGGASIDCKACHHEYAGPESTPPQACSNCHYSHSSARIKVLPSL